MSNGQSNSSDVLENDLKYNIKRSLGSSQSEKSSNVVITLNNRERNLGKNGFGFSHSQCQRINNNYLPNSYCCVSKYISSLFCGDFSNDGNIFVTASHEKLLCLYNSSSSHLKKIAKLCCLSCCWSILDIQISSDNRFVYYSTWSDKIGIWNIEKYLTRPDPDNVYLGIDRYHSLGIFNQNGPIFSFSLSPDEKKILCGSTRGFAYLYDVALERTTYKINAHCDDVNSVKWDKNSPHILYSAGDDGLCKVWDIRTLNQDNPKHVGCFAGHRCGVTYIDLKGDGRYLITNSKDQTVKLWDMRAFSSEKTIRNTIKWCWEKQWDYRTENIPREFQNDQKIDGDTSVLTFRNHLVRKTLIRSKFSPQYNTGQRYIYVGSDNGQVFIYDILTNFVKSVNSDSMSCIRDVSWHPIRNELYSVGFDGRVLQWFYSSMDDDQPCSLSTPMFYRPLNPSMPYTDEDI